MKAHLRSSVLMTALAFQNVNAFTVSPEAILVSAAPTFHRVETSVSHLPSHQELALRSSTSLLSEAAIAATTTPVATTTTSPAATTTTTPAAVAITNLQYDGQVPTTESDEYVVLTNRSKSPMNIGNYMIYVASNGTQGATFTFPKDAVLAPGASVRVYTNEIHKETGGYSFGSKKAIWNNKGGLAVLKDAAGKKLGEYKY